MDARIQSIIWRYSALRYGAQKTKGVEMKKKKRKGKEIK